MNILSSSFATAILSIVTATSHATQSDIISWVRSKGGSFSEKLEIRKHQMGYMGVFATSDISAKETLFNIPHECYIQVFDEAENMDLDELEDATGPYYNNLCKLAHKLMEEMKLGESSEFAPYIAYLKTQKSGQLPANWSQAGKDTIRKIAIPGSPIVDWIDWNFKQRHCIKDDPFEEHIVEMTVQRCFDTALIPIWDMVNHDNGRINTENDSMYDKEGFKVRAARDIKAGEEIFATYDKCVDCYGIDAYWGTPEILKDFGFVEGYPHRWVFYDEGIWFEIYEDEDGELEAIFDDDTADSYGIPNKEQIQFLQKEINRLNDVGKIVLNDQGDVPDREWQTIKNLHTAAVTDISAAIEEVAYIESSATPGAEL